MIDQEYDNIKNPKHYDIEPISCPNCKEKIHLQTWDIIALLKLDYFLGNVLKYFSRAGKKPNVELLEDYKKARQYLNKEIELLEDKIDDEIDDKISF